MSLGWAGLWFVFWHFDGDGLRVSEKGRVVPSRRIQLRGGAFWLFGAEEEELAVAARLGVEKRTHLIGTRLIFMWLR